MSSLEITEPLASANAWDVMSKIRSVKNEPHDKRMGLSS
jgi:hypothetical protein